MAKQPETQAQDSLLREVDDALRQEKMARLWRAYKKPLLYALIALVAATALGSIWQQYRYKQGEHAMQRLDMAIATFQEGGRAEAAKMLGALAEDSSGEQRDLALLWQARVLESMGHEKEAAKQLTIVSQNRSGDLLWRDLACLRLMGLSKDLPDSCASGEGSPLRSLRDEWRAGQLWQQGKVKEARALLAVIANGEDDNIPRSQRTRAAELLALISSSEEKE